MEGSRDRRKLEELLDFSPLPGKALPQRVMAKKPLRRDFCRPGGAAPCGATGRIPLLALRAWMEAGRDMSNRNSYKSLPFPPHPEQAQQAHQAR